MSEEISTGVWLRRCSTRRGAEIAALNPSKHMPARPRAGATLYCEFIIKRRRPSLRWSLKAGWSLAPTRARPLGAQVAAPARASRPGSTYVVNRVTDKLTKITDHVYCCRSVCDAVCGAGGDGGAGLGGRHAVGG